MKQLLSILYIILALSAFGQHKAERELSTFLGTNNIDTFVYVKSGCTGCMVSYEGTAEPVDIVTIQLLYQKKRKQYLVVLSDTSQIKQFGQKESSIFSYIPDNRQTLKDKEAYYKQANMAKFQAPCLVTFPYETIELKTGQFKHRHTLVERESDDCGTVLTHYGWFKVEVEILKQFDIIKKSDERTTGGLLQ